MGQVERIEIAPGFTISRVLTGLWQIADMEKDGTTLDPVKTAPAMQPYFDAGLTTFDMADHYGSAEIITGTFQQSLPNPDDVQLFTKWVPKPGPVTRDEVRAAVQTSLDRMQAKSLDLLQFHCWNYGDPVWLDCLYWLQEMRDEGLIKNLGMTNIDTAHLRMALTSGIDIVTNQVCYSMLDQRASGAMTNMCEEFGVKLLAFGTLAGGFLTDKWFNKPEPDWDNLATMSQMKYGRYIRTAGGWDVYQNLLQAMNNVAQKNNVSIANVACRYMLEQPAVGGVIIGARLGESEHIADNLKLFEFELGEDGQAEIQEALSQMTPIPGDCGDEYRKPPFLTATGDLSDHLETFPPPYTTQVWDDGSSRVLTGTIWEPIAGFSRAVQRGDRISISGTTATHNNQVVGGNDPASQTHFVIDKIEGALQSLGSQLEDVVRTRIYIQNIDDWEPISRAHGERFGHILPANTLVQAGIIGDEYLVEIEADAIRSHASTEQP
ncbi:MAG: aldo/keto reductase [Anaerolineae bacterium]